MRERKMREKDLMLTEVNKFCLSQTCPRFDTIQATVYAYDVLYSETAIIKPNDDSLLLCYVVFMSICTVFLLSSIMYVCQFLVCIAVT